MKLGKHGDKGQGAFVYIEGMSLSRLKDVCRKYGLPVSGTTSKLEGRLKKHVEKLRKEAQRERLKMEMEERRAAKKRKRAALASQDAKSKTCASSDAETGTGAKGEAGGTVSVPENWGPAPAPAKKLKRNATKDDSSSGIPPWGQFLEGIDLDNATYKRVKALAKRARVGAGGGRLACVERLRAFLDLESAPVWWQDEERKKALVIRLEDTLPEDEGDTSEAISVAMRVGQRAEFTGYMDKVRSRSARLVKADPAGCVVEKRRPRRSGFGRHKMMFTAVRGGHAEIHMTTNSRGVKDALCPRTRTGPAFVVTVSE